MSKVKVIYHREPEGWWAESPDVAGYTAADSDFGGLRELVLDGLPFLLDDPSVAISEQLSDGAPIAEQGASMFNWLRSFAEPKSAGFALPTATVSSVLVGQ